MERLEQSEINFLQDAHKVRPMPRFMAPSAREPNAVRVTPQTRVIRSASSFVTDAQIAEALALATARAAETAKAEAVKAAEALALATARAAELREKCGVQASADTEARKARKAQVAADRAGIPEHRPSQPRTKDHRQSYNTMAVKAPGLWYGFAARY